MKEINEYNEKFYYNIIKVDNKIAEKILKVELDGRIKTNIFISKDSKNQLVNSIKNQLPSNTNIAENFFSKLFDKDNYISSIINYSQNYFKNFNINYEKEVVFKCLFNRKEIKENLKINEIGLKDNSKILVLDALKIYNIIFKNLNNLSSIAIIGKEYEIFASIVEKFRIQKNIINKNIKFIYNALIIDWSLTLYEIFRTDAVNPIIYYSEY